MLMLKLKPEIFKPTRRQFLAGAAVAGAGLSVSFRVPGARAESGGRAQSLQRLCHHLARQQGDDPLGPHGHGPGRLSRHRHPGGRGTGGRSRPAGGGRRRRQPEALRQSRLGRRGARHRRIVGDVLVVRPLPQGRRARPHHAGQRRRQAVERSGRRDQGREGRGLACFRQAGDVRRAGRCRGAGAGAGRGRAEAARPVEGDRLGGLPPHRLASRSRPASSTTPST